ncbi:MAG TPA: biotin transporter BioY [Firmicutes bacterium]|nr:biotin transporter BioY [Bacillota bacterium]
MDRPKHNSAKKGSFDPTSLARVAMFTAAAVAASLLGRFGSSLVPFSLLPMVALLAGCLLGPRLGATTMALYLFLGLAGLPVFSAPPYAGIAYVLKPSFGFLPGFVLAAAVAGSLATDPRRLLEIGTGRFCLAALSGLGCLYLVGLPYLWVILNLYLHQPAGLDTVLRIGFWPFIALDIIKALAAASVARAVRVRLAPRPIGLRERKDTV